MMFVVPTWSDTSPQPSSSGNSNAAPQFLSAEEWLLGTSIVLATVLGTASETTRNAAIVAYTTASVALCIALIPWLWTAWLERRSDRIATWRLMATSLGVVGAAQLAATVAVIGHRGPAELSSGTDLLWIAGAAIGIFATHPMIRRQSPDEAVIRRYLLSGLIAGLSSLVLLFVARIADSHNQPRANVDWLIAWATVALPLTTSLLWWSTMPKPEIGSRSRRVAMGWLCLTVAMSGFALDRLFVGSHLSPRTSWATIPSAAFLALSALGILQNRSNGTLSLFHPVTVQNGSAGLEFRPWLRSTFPYVGFAAFVAIAIGLLTREKPHFPSVIAVVVSLVFAALILLRQTLAQTNSARAAKQLEQARLELATRANIDPVTGLPNRRALDDRLAEEVERAQRYRQPLSLCFIDLDRFKQINDDHGHAAGDAALRQVGSLLRRTARGIDFVGRFGGEEFVVLVPGTWSVDAATLGERLCRAVAETSFDLTDDQTIRLTISIGIAGLPEHAQDAGSLNECADKALYTAKRSGRNQVVLYEPGA
ncbi:MAG TPA: GGDEF domain-containing protein [Thermomicrobiales bacterium]|jgi:diguanylate cyclase (GGDEF)-like protein